ncbi:MAG: hypothetical protein ABR886_02940 [Dehalococcoidales bacterium]|jgi:hypothetical protein
MDIHDQNEKKSKLPWTMVLLSLAITVIISSLITWGLISGLSISRTTYNSDINRLNMALNHINDTATGLSSYDIYQNSQINDLDNRTQVQLEEITGRVTDDEANIDTKAAATDLSNLKDWAVSNMTDLGNTLDTKVNSSDFTTLQNTVNTKANNSDLTALKDKVNALTISIPSGLIDKNNDTDHYIWTADAAYQVVSIKFQQSAVEITNTATALMLKKVPNGYTISYGYDLLTTSTPVNLSTGVAANTFLTATLNTTTSYLQFAAGDSLALNFSAQNALSEYVGCVTITLKRM